MGMENIFLMVTIMMYVVFICAMGIFYLLWKDIKALKIYIKTELEVNKIVLMRNQRILKALLQEQERHKEAVTEQIKKQLEHVPLSDSWEEAETTREVGEAITKMKKKNTDADTDEDSVFIVN